MKLAIWKKYWIVICMALMLGKIECFATESEEKLSQELYATSAVLMDGESGRILYEKNADAFMANASTTKIMTCILALEMAQLDELVSVSAYAASMPDVQMHIHEGEQYRMEDLLYALMLESYNDVAVAIAEHIGGSQEQFSVLMNQKAKMIGCENTLFLTPNGLDAEVKNAGVGKIEQKRFHGTTAKDLALIMRYCIHQSPQKEKFVQITAKPSHRLTDVQEKREFQCRNHNSLFQLLDGVISGKTGFTGKAGYCYVGAVEQEGKKYVLALLACGWPSNRNYKWQDCKKLISYGNATYQKYSLEDLLQPHMDELCSDVRGAKREQLQEEYRVKLVRKKSDESHILLKPSEKMKVEIHKKEMMAPVEQGQIAGEIIYYINNEIWKKEWLYSAQNVEKIDYLWGFKIILKKFV